MYLYIGITIFALLFTHVEMKYFMIIYDQELFTFVTKVNLHTYNHLHTFTIVFITKFSWNS
jgi:hypothetical protein